MHAYAELHFNYIVHVKVLRLQDCPPSCPAAPPSLPPPPPPPPRYTGRRGRYRPRGRRAGRGRGGRPSASTNVSYIIEIFTKHCNN